MFCYPFTGSMDDDEAFTLYPTRPSSPQNKVKRNKNNPGNSRLFFCHHFVFPNLSEHFFFSPQWIEVDFSYLVPNLMNPHLQLVVGKHHLWILALPDFTVKGQRQWPSCLKWNAFFEKNPGKLTWDPKLEVWKMIFLFNLVMFRFQVNFQGFYSWS